jgi:hypothetical protein
MIVVTEVAYLRFSYHDHENAVQQPGQVTTITSTPTAS